MEGEKVKIRVTLTLMVLAVAWGINTAASVINLWMDKTVAPQVFVMDEKPEGVEVQILGYSLIWHDEYSESLEAAVREQLNFLTEKGSALLGDLIPKGVSLGRDLAERARDANIYLREFLGNFFFKDG